VSDQADEMARPWPAPARPWALAMRWHDLLFMHWPLRPEALRPLIPPSLHLDTFDGAAWLGVIPFHMTGVRPHYLPALPWFSAFPELNVRTYVTVEGKPGVWFFSLDATNALAVRGARFLFRLPYHDARMVSVRRTGVVYYSSCRTHHGAAAAELVARYRPIGPAAPAPEGSIDRWLTDRYCLYAANRRGGVWRCEINHARWPLQPAEAEIERNTMCAPLRLSLPSPPPLLHFAERLEVVAWTLKAVATRGRW
jgi:uncharacterized protein YqjF (DUF2071 family)